MFEKNLKYYRLKKNMSMKDLADAVGVTSMAISNYESGKRQPEIEIINKMAEVLGIKVVDFLASRNSHLEIKHCEFRKHSTLTKTQQEFIRESVEEYFSRFFDALDCLCGDPLPTPPECYTLELSGSYQHDALNLREHLGLPKEGPIDELIGILENKGIIVFELDIDDDHFSGMNGFVNGYPFIVINKNMNPERKRTTIIHELAHLMFIWDESKEKENELLATQIAGAFLITDADLFRELGLKKTRLTRDMILVCEEYGISMYLLVKRAAQVKIMSNSLEKEFYIKANKAHWNKHEPQRVKKLEEPLLFKQLVYRAVNEEGVSIQRGAELLQMPYSDVEKYCGLMEV
ncbi:Zn-dependent peptidase ImmA, M78 family [Butyrivibrio sp. INlla18]|uniref:XRE family transcriptional regulator n=1 Tax=Butyrivibrio sp. INlla18 TaxID=1520806 RepID=UPI00088BCFD9|nr:XRE family transcriptional regulator [Butyrivibrio sp. INlla18]SDA63167.1 Zn-dependent peptidase ImmA, M78 family [Butyrivibrio sp. INlla18]